MRIAVFLAAVLVSGAALAQKETPMRFALDWRFKPRWLVRAVVGDRGTTTLDVLWNRWY